MCGQTTEPGKSRDSARLSVVSLLVGFVLIAGAAVPSQPSPPAFTPKQQARVVIARNDQALDAFKPRPEVVQTLLDRGLLALTDQPDRRSAWLSLVGTQDVVGLKVFSGPGVISGTRPALVAAVARGLLEAGLPPDHIVIWDKKSDDLQRAGFYRLAADLGIRAEAVDEAGWDESKFYDRALIGNLVWGDHEFGKKEDGIGRKSFVSKLVSYKLTKIVILTPLINHNDLGVTGHLYNLAMGSVDNTARFENNPAQMAEAVPEIFAMEMLADRVALCITDALICQYLGEVRGLLHYSSVLSELRFGKDPVALDVLAFQEMERQRRRHNLPPRSLKTDLFSNASLLWLGVSDSNNIKVEYAALP